MIELKDGDCFMSSGKRYCFRGGQAVEMESYLGGEPVTFKEVAINQPFYIQMVKVDHGRAISAYKSLSDAHTLSDNEPVEINVNQKVDEPVRIMDMALDLGDVISLEFRFIENLDNGFQYFTYANYSTEQRFHIPSGLKAVLVKRAE